MKTSSWFLYGGPGRIGISRAVPRRMPRGYRLFKELAPGPWFASVSRDEYERRFGEEILGPLDPQVTWDRLHELAGEAEPVLLCFENLGKPGLWCHRRMVADWFERRLGVEVPEWRDLDRPTRSPVAGPR